MSYLEGILFVDLQCKDYKDVSMNVLAQMTSDDNTMTCFDLLIIFLTILNRKPFPLSRAKPFFFHFNLTLFKSCLLGRSNVLY